MQLKDPKNLQLAMRDAMAAFSLAVKGEEMLWADDGVVQKQAKDRLDKARALIVTPGENSVHEQLFRCAADTDVISGIIKDGRERMSALPDESTVFARIYLNTFESALQKHEQESVRKASQAQQSEQADRLNAHRQERKASVGR